MFLAACQGDQVSPGDRPLFRQALEWPSQGCGTPNEGTILGGTGQQVARFTLINDDQFVWLRIIPEAGITTASASVYIGPRISIPVNSENVPTAAEFPFQSQWDKSEKQWVMQFALAELSECNAVVIELEYSEGNRAPARAWAMGNHQETILHYCLQPCTRQQLNCNAGTEPGQFTTYLQENWKQKATRGRLTAATFRQAFPSGLELGCHHKITLADYEALMRFLPSHGFARVLEASSENPAKGAVSNDLAGELCAAVLAVKLDAIDPTFSASQASLGSLVITEGLFEGWTVDDLLAEAQVVLGQCGSDYSASQILEGLSRINREFESGSVSLGFLKCPPAKL